MVLDLGDRKPQPKGMMCPHCHEGLKMSSREGIEIDYCPSCRGVWLDKGELDKIIERSVRDVAPAQPQRAQPMRERHYDDDEYRYRSKKHYKPYKKRKSWIAEIFDELT